MKNQLLFFAFTFLLLFVGHSQTTNVEGSTYKFKPIVSHDCLPVESQGKTSTCWCFSSLSFFESELLRMGKKDVVPLSEMFIVRNAYSLKAEKYVRMDGKINFGEGGAFHDVPLVIKKFGIVPKEIYSGITSNGLTGKSLSDKRGEGYNHQEFFRQIEELMNEKITIINKGQGLALKWKEELDHFLEGAFGALPRTFDWKGKKYTPKSYAESLGLNMDNYVSITSFTNHEMNKKCLLEIPDNWAWGESYNVSLDDLTQTTISALKSGYTIAWGADVSEKGFSFKNGIGIVPADEASIEVKGQDSKGFNDAGADRTGNQFLIPGEELKITPELRQLAYDEKLTTDDHGMHIVGLFTDQNGKIYFYVKNSWGTENFPKGYLFVSENYFRYKTINIYLHKDGIPKEVRSKIGL